MAALSTASKGARDGRVQPGRARSGLVESARLNAQRDTPRDRRGAAVTTAHLVTRHLRIGWWSLALFGALGLVLETLHAFKIGLYLDASNDTRRLMWTLAHAHGTLLGLMHLGFAWTVETAALAGTRVTRASGALVASGFLLPAGFFLGGIRFYAGDPGLGIAIVPIGAALAIYGAVEAARLLTRRSPGDAR
jgi:hypothetical protein